MDRPIVYTQEQARSTDFLFASRSAMIGLSKLAAAILGTSTAVNNLACTPTSPAGLTVNVSQGEIYSMAPVDASQYGVLPADTADTILKQGIVLGTTNFSCPAPTTTGYSINYLIEAIYQDTDTTNVVLPYFNSANPSQPLSGQNNSGAPQSTERQGQCILAIKAGAAAATGSQVTPAPDSGYTALWVVTVANGQTGITSANIAQVPGAPFLTQNLQSILSSLAGYAQLGATQAWTKGQSGAPVPIAFGATVTPNLAAANNFIVTGISANFTLANPANAVGGQSGVIEFTQNATGSYTITTFGSVYIGANGSKPNLAATANGTDLIFYYVLSTGKILLTTVPKAA